MPMVSSIPTTDHTQPTTDVLVEHDDAVGVITINRPARLNAVTPAAGAALRSAFLELEADSRIRAVVLTGAGRGFCAGADISGDVGDARQVLLEAWNPLVMTMQSLQLPILAAINGVAAGAGRRPVGAIRVVVRQDWADARRGPDVVTSPRCRAGTRQRTSIPGRASVSGRGA
jgi:enoyl-CoA hydratase/carnithine racemase